MYSDKMIQLCKLLLSLLEEFRYSGFWTMLFLDITNIAQVHPYLLIVHI